MAVGLLCFFCLPPPPFSSPAPVYLCVWTCGCGSSGEAHLQIIPLIILCYITPVSSPLWCQIVLPVTVTKSIASNHCVHFVFVPRNNILHSMDLLVSIPWGAPSHMIVCLFCLVAENSGFQNSQTTVPACPPACLPTSQAHSTMSPSEFSKMVWYLNYCLCSLCIWLQTERLDITTLTFVLH